MVEDTSLGVAVDAAGNNYVTGYFRDTATFESTDATVVTLIGTGGPDIFLAKYNRHGVLQWLTRAGGAGFDEGWGIAVDWFGNSYVAGRFNGMATFGGEENEQVLVSDRVGTFVAKYACDGALLWVKQIVSAEGGFNEARDIAVDWSGNSYVTGWFQQSATFGLGEVNETTLHEPGGRNTFVAKYDPRGAFVWARQADTANADGAWGVAVDSRGNAYVTGTFANVARFGVGDANETTLFRMNGVARGFVAKYDRHGMLSWARLGGGFAIAVDDSGNADVTGEFARGELPFEEIGVTFGLGEPNETTLISAGATDIFVAKYAEPLHHRDVTSFAILDDLMTVSDVGASFPIPLRAIVTATFTNVSSIAIKNPFFAVSEATGAAVLINGDGPPQGVDATLSPDVGDGVLSPGESTDVTFVIRLESREPFRFFVNVRGEPVY